MTAKMVGVIDGENVAFAIVQAGPELRLEAVREFRTSDFPTFTDALQSYTRANQVQTSNLSFGLAVAGVARGDVIALANCRWYISVSGLNSFFGRAPLVLNDFAATAWSLVTLDPRQLKPVGPIPPRPIAAGRTFLVVGTGPGLGAAILVVGPDGKATALESEGGHGSFAPQSEREDLLLQALRTRFGHVSYERLVSNHGLEFVHGWLIEHSGRSGPRPTSDQILAAALRGDPTAREATDIFASALGAFAGNGVLTAGAWDGVFLVSPMLRQMLPLLQEAPFRTAFVAKGRMRKALEKVPTSFADNKSASLAGAAAALIARDGGA